jgi:2-haloacid dehalogenase
MVFLAFDMYGTLCDPQAVTQRLASYVSEAEQVAQVWRRKQLEYTFMVSMMGQYENFWQLTRRALDYALESAGVTLSEADIEHIMDAYHHLELFPDTKEGLQRMHDAGFRMIVLSNGSPDMLRDLAENTGIASYFEALVSVDQVRVFKPSPRVYQLAAEHFGCGIGEVWMVSSNSFDAVGAKVAGMQVAWVNRHGDVLDKIGRPPDLVTDSLVTLAQTLIQDPGG